MLGRIHRVAKFIIPSRFWTEGRNWLKRCLVSLLDLNTDWSPHPRVQVGRYTFGLKHESIPVIQSPNYRIFIGSFCSIAPGVRFILGVHQMECPTTFPIRECVLKDMRPELWPEETIRVGHDVWIASNALILSGTTIGHGAIVAAGAVVSRDVPPYAVVAGVPARIIRWRMSPEQIEKMLAIAWWDWPDEKIIANFELFYGDVNSFIKAHWPASNSTELTGAAPTKPGEPVVENGPTLV